MRSGELAVDSVDSIGVSAAFGAGDVFYGEGEGGRAVENDIGEPDAQGEGFGGVDGVVDVGAVVEVGIDNPTEATMDEINEFCWM